MNDDERMRDLGVAMSRWLRSWQNVTLNDLSPAWREDFVKMLFDTQAMREMRIGAAVLRALGGLTNPGDLRLTAQSHWRAGFQLAADMFDAIAAALEAEKQSQNVTESVTKRDCGKEIDDA